MSAIIFSGGELHVTDQTFREPFRIQSANDLVELLMSNEIYSRNGSRDDFKKIIIPYFPYARQDRITEKHTAFSLKVFAKLINDLNFDEVVSLDVHSDVTPALVNNMRVVSQ